MIISSIDNSDYCLHKGEYGDNKDQADEHEEIFVIVFAHARAYPWAVVVESLHAYITLVAMRGPRRTIY